MAIGDELLTLEFAPSDRNSLMRGIGQVRLLRGEPVDDLFAEYAEVLDSEGRPPGGVELRSRRWRSGTSSPVTSPAPPRSGRGPARTVTLNAASDLPRAARAAIWAGDLPTAERLTAEIAKDWAHGQCAHARLTGLTAGLAATAGRRDDAIAGYATAIATLRELGLEVDAVLTILDMARTLGATDPAVVPWLEEARASIERLRMPGLNGLLEIASGGRRAGSAGSVRAEVPGDTFATEATG